MKVTIKIERKHLIVLATLLFFTIASFAAAVVINPKFFHPLQDIARSATDTVSVDADGDGIIDLAERAGVIPPPPPPPPGPPPPPPLEECTEGQTRSCTMSNSCAGTQTCTNGAWSSCVQNDPKCGIAGECRPGDTDIKEIKPGCIGIMECQADGTWGPLELDPPGCSDFPRI